MAKYYIESYKKEEQSFLAGLNTMGYNGVIKEPYEIKLKNTIGKSTDGGKTFSWINPKVVENRDTKIFLNWLDEPNAIPSPSNRRELFNHIYSEYFRTGVSGAVFTFKKPLSIDSFKNIQLAEVQVNYFVKQ